MSSAYAALRDIVAGSVPANHALLQNCWLEGFGGRTFGREAILARFQEKPVDLPDAPDLLHAPRAFLTVSNGVAVFADVHEARIARLWVLGADKIGSPETEVSVPRDLDLSQSEGDLVFDPADHPELATSHSEFVATTVKSSILAASKSELDLPSFARRAFVVRAFSQGERVAALIVVAGALDATRRKPFSVNVAATGDTRRADHAVEIVVDRAGLSHSLEQAWTPRL